MNIIERVQSQIEELVLSLEELFYDWAEKSGIDKAVSDQLVVPLVENSLEVETTSDNVSLQVTKLVKLRAKIVRFAVLNRQLDRMLDSAIAGLTALADWLSVNVFEETVDLSHLTPPDLDTTEWSRMPPDIPPSVKRQIEQNKEGRDDTDILGGFGRPL